MDLGKMGWGKGTDGWNPPLLGCSPLHPPLRAPPGSQSQLVTPRRAGEPKKCCNFQINCEFNDCVHEYLITHIFHEYARYANGRGKKR